MRVPVRLCCPGIVEAPPRCSRNRFADADTHPGGRISVIAMSSTSIGTRHTDDRLEDTEYVTRTQILQGIQVLLRCQVLRGPSVFSTEVLPCLSGRMPVDTRMVWPGVEDLRADKPSLLDLR